MWGSLIPIKGINFFTRNNRNKSFAVYVRIHKIVLFEKKVTKNKHKNITRFHGNPVHES